MKYGYATPLGVYAVFFDQALMLENTVNGAVGRDPMTGFVQLPFDGRHPDLGKSLRIQLPADVYNM